MAFNDDETSVQNAAPIELFKFTGTYETWRLTNAPRDKTNSDGTYLSQFAVQRSEREQGTQEDDDITMDVEMDASHPMVAAYAIQEPPPSLLLEIFRAHPADLDDTFKIWEGEVISWSLSGRVAKARVPSLFSFLLDSPIPRPRYQNPCNHFFGDPFCGIDLDAGANTHDTTISTISGTAITVADNPLADADLPAGQLIAGTERRMIVAASGTDLTISSPFSANVAASDAVTIKRGCDNAFGGDCVATYANGDNYSGYGLFVPGRNPFDGRF